MDHDEESIAERAEIVVLEIERVTVVAQVHLDGEGIARRVEVVADHAVHHRDQRLALGTRRTLTEHGLELREREIDPGADHSRDRADAAVDRAGDQARGQGERRSQHRAHVGAMLAVLPGSRHARQDRATWASSTARSQSRA